MTKKRPQCLITTRADQSSHLVQLNRRIRDLRTDRTTDMLTHMHKEDGFIVARNPAPISICLSHC